MPHKTPSAVAALHRYMSATASLQGVAGSATWGSPYGGEHPRVAPLVPLHGLQQREVSQRGLSLKDIHLFEDPSSWIDSATAVATKPTLERPPTARNTASISGLHDRAVLSAATIQAHSAGREAVHSSPPSQHPEVSTT